MGRDRNVLVLGAGLLGCHVTRALLDDGMNVHVLTRSMARPEFLPLLEGAKVRLGDARNPKVVTAALDFASHVVYALGCPPPAKSNADPAGDAGETLIPVITVLEALRSAQGVGFTFFSSGGTVYGESMNGSLCEEAPLDPLTSYGVLKVAAEKYIGMYSRLWGTPTTILRAANAYGPGQSATTGQGAVARFLHCARYDLPVTLYGDGGIVRDYVHVHDIGGVVARVLRAGTAPPVLNVGTGRGTSLNELLDMVMAVTGTSLTVRHRPGRSLDVRRNVLDISRLQSTIEYRPIPLLRGLGMTWDSIMDFERPGALVEGR